MKKYTRKKLRGGSQMNLAILIVGRIKGYTHVEQKLLDLKNKYNATIFCSLNKQNKSDYIQKFCNTFDIKDDQLNLENTPEVPDFMKQLPRTPNDIMNMYSQFFHVKKSFELLDAYQKKYNVLFDAVLYYRADIDNYEDLILPPLKENTIFNFIEKSLYNSKDNIIKELLYGNYKNMKKYSNIVNFLERLIKQYKCTIFECLIKKYIVDIQKIRISKISYNHTLHESRHTPLPEYNNIH